MREEDIRPPGSYEALLEAARGASEKLLAEREQFVWSPCPCCGEPPPGRGTFFSKEGYLYHECLECRSLYVSPRPTELMLSRFYKEMYVFEDFYALSHDARMKDIVLPRARMLCCQAEAFGLSDSYCDIGCGAGDLIQTVLGTGWFKRVFGIDPSAAYRQDETCGCCVYPGTLEDLGFSVEADVASAFEVIEHVFSPERFLRAGAELLRPGGILVFSTLTCSGWDIAELWNKHQAVCPPMHLNLLSVQGVRSLIVKAGLELREISTPGRLDVDILRNHLSRYPSLKTSRFAKSIAEADEATRDGFQEFLAGHGLSSHVMAVARRAAP